MRALIKYLIILLVLLFNHTSCQKNIFITSSDVLVLVNSNSSEISKGTEKLLPYLDHFGIKYYITDLAMKQVPSDPYKYALVIISHADITAGNKYLKPELENFLGQCRKEGTGILSFDPLMSGSLLIQPNDEYLEDKNVGEIHFSEEEHYITGFHHPGDKKNLFGYMSIPKLVNKEGIVLLTGNNHPLLVVSRQGSGKVVQWTSQDWMYYSILGPMGGLDDCLWKSIVWAARKPFVMQALPPLVTMRVDDVFGCDRQQWDETPFNWVKITNKYGFKPWLGLFIYNMTPEGIEELKELTNKGLATASPHALGRPLRTRTSKKIMPEYWYPDAIPHLSDTHDEFIFFNHQGEKPWSDEIAEIALKAVDDWYNDVGPLPMSNYMIPHFYEMGSNILAHIYDKWDIQFIFSRLMPDKPFDGHHYTKMHLSGPFNVYDEPVVGNPKEDAINSRSFYTAYFTELAGREFFIIGTEINDIIGYEWKPDNDIDATAHRGIETIRRGIEAKALAVLFTHETDFIYKIKPENWDSIFSQISDGISSYNPLLLTTDEALKIVRAFHSSEIEYAKHNLSSGELKINITGHTDMPTSVHIYTEDNERIIENLYEIPVFNKELTKVFHIRNQ